MSPRYYTRRLTVPLRDQLSSIAVAISRYWQIKRNRRRSFWWTYITGAFLMFGYQMNHYVAFLGNKPDIAGTIAGSGGMALFWPLVVSTWMFA